MKTNNLYKITSDVLQTKLEVYKKYVLDCDMYPEFSEHMAERDVREEYIKNNIIFTVYKFKNNYTEILHMFHEFTEILDIYWGEK